MDKRDISVHQKALSVLWQAQMESRTDEVGFDTVDDLFEEWGPKWDYINKFYEADIRSEIYNNKDEYDKYCDAMVQVMLMDYNKTAWGVEGWKTKS